MKRKKYYYLDPVIIRIPGIKTLFERALESEMQRQNQVCSNEKYIPLLSLMQR